MILLLGAALAQEGWYAVTIRTTTVAEVPVIGELRSVTESKLLLQVQDRDGALWGVHQVCGIEITGDSDMAHTVLPPAFVEAMKRQEYPVSFATAEGGEVTVHADMGLVAVGFDPVLGFPAAKEDQGVVDHEQDSYPGATVVVEVPVFRDVMVYVAQSSRIVIDGNVDASGAVVGTTKLEDFSQVILDADHPLFLRAPHVAGSTGDFTWEPLPGPSRCEAVVGGS